jgi:hypothetical protein
MLIGGILYSSAHKTWIQLSYEINKLEIIEKFCVNKDETSFRCDGKCYLKKQLKEAEPKAKNEASTTEENRITFFSLELSPLLLTAPTEKKETISFYQNLYSFLKEESIFHPPIV